MVLLISLWNYLCNAEAQKILACINKKAFLLDYKLTECQLKDRFFIAYWITQEIQC